MEYKSLESVYYSDHDVKKQKYEQIYQNYINNISAHILKQKTNGYPMFYIQTEELSNKLYQIKDAEKQLYYIINELPGIAIGQYTRFLLVNEINITNEIEGVRSTRKEINEIIDTNSKTDKNERLFNLVKKYSKLQSGEEIPLKTCEDIKALYDEIVLPEVISNDENDKPDGVLFRKSPVYIRDEKQEIIHSGLVPEEKIIEGMNNVLQVIHDPQLNPLIKIAVVHYMIGYIHPYYNGNGRLNRFISSYLISQELEPLIGYGISYTIKTNKQKYAKLFSITNKSQNRGDLTLFIYGFFDIILEAITNITTNLTRKTERFEYFTNILSSIKDERRYSVLYILLQNALFDENGLTAKEILNVTQNSISYQTLLKIFKQYAPVLCGDIHNKRAYTLNLEKLDEMSEVISKL